MRVGTFGESARRTLGCETGGSGTGTGGEDGDGDGGGEGGGECDLGSGVRGH